MFKKNNLDKFHNPESLYAHLENLEKVRAKRLQLAALREEIDTLDAALDADTSGELTDEKKELIEKYNTAVEKSFALRYHVLELEKAILDFEVDTWQPEKS